MSTDLERKSTAVHRPLARRNSMAFPRELRDAIAPLHDGRVLESDYINGSASNTELFGPLVELKLVLMRLRPEAAVRLAGTLTALADEAERTSL
jgi:hypothetical protein